MKLTKYIKSSEVTTYEIKLKQIKESLFTVSVKYVIEEKVMNTPILYYRVKDETVAKTTFEKIIDIVETNKENLCIEKMKNWLFNTHIIRYLIKSRN